jgi:carbonic anhydrase/SulP family sulfate permease
VEQNSDVWAIDPSHLLEVPVAGGWTEILGFLKHPNFSAFQLPAVYMAGATLAAVASLETLLNLEVLDRLDPQQRSSPSNRELLAQGLGNMTAALVGGLPVTSMIVGSSVNVSVGAKTKSSAVSYGLLMVAVAVATPLWLKEIPPASLAAVLLVTGVRLANPSVFRQMWREGKSQFIPFIVTVLGIVFTDLLVGVLLGAATSIAFILRSNFLQPIHRVIERHVSGDVLGLDYRTR